VSVFVCSVDYSNTIISSTETMRLTQYSDEWYDFQVPLTFTAPPLIQGATNNSYWAVAFEPRCAAKNGLPILPTSDPTVGVLTLRPGVPTPVTYCGSGFQLFQSFPSTDSVATWCDGSAGTLGAAVRVVSRFLPRRRSVECNSSVSRA
jgi:hypothetical protein